MKVQSQPQAPQASTIQKANPTVSADKAAAPAPQGNAGQLQDRFRDGFEPGRKIIDCFPPFDPMPKGGLNLGDHINASKLPETLANPLDKVLLEKGEKDVPLRRDEQGVMRGPEGEPLAKVQLDDGTTAYVDPNTNQYYLTDERELFGQTNAIGPLPLPEGSQFSNSYFSDADVRSIEKAAQGGNGWPFPRPPIDPLPLPPRPFPFPVEPRPIPRDPWGPMPKFDPSVLLAANGAGKASGLE